jgi:hypothetical protein
MRTTRWKIALVASALIGAHASAPALAAQDTAPLTPAPAAAAGDAILYPSTLTYGTGLIDIPVAWVSPNSGDIWVTASGKIVNYCATVCTINFADKFNTNLSIDTHWKQRFSIGLSVYSQNPDYGFYGQALVYKQQPSKLWPSLAVGFRNLGPDSHEDRFLVGNDVFVSPTGGITDTVPAPYKHFHSVPTVYAVATKEFTAGSNGAASFSLGYGSGIFHDDGGLGRNYNDKGTIVKGLFLGARYALRTSENSSVTILGENNGWDWNAGVVGNWRGLFLGVYGTELEEGSKDPSKGSLYTVYNYTKFNVSLGYSGNLHDIAHGTILRARIGELEQEQLRLHAQITQRQHKIEDLQASLQKAQGGELAEVAKRREQLDAQIQEEQDAIKRAEERLNQLQGGSPPPTTTPPPSTTTPPR